MKRKIIRKKKNPEIKKYEIEYIKLEDVISDFTNDEKEKIIYLLDPDLKRVLYTLGSGYDPDAPQGYNKCFPIIVRTSEFIDRIYEFHEMDRHRNTSFGKILGKIQDIIYDIDCDYMDVNIKDVDWYSS